MAKETKNIGTFRMTFKSKVNEAEPNKCFMTWTIGDNLKEKLKKVIVAGEVESTYYDGVEDVTFQRHLVKGYVYSSIYGGARSILFAKTLLETGSIELGFNSISARDNLRSDLKSVTRSFLKIIEQADIEENVSFVIRREE